MLRPYQEQALRAIVEGFKRGVHRQLLVMATGLGKTVVVSALAAKSQWGPGKRFFGIMHREELIAQAIERLRELNPDRRIDFEKAQHAADGAADIVLASVQTVGRMKGSRLAKFPPGDFSKLWIDEVHHAPARSYRTVMEHFGVAGNPATPKLLLGTTATPERLDRLGYDALFDDVVFRYDLRHGIEDGWLADLACYRVKTDVDLTDVKVRAGEFVESDLARVVDTGRRNQVFTATYLERARGGRNLIFCVNKAHAGHVAELLRGEGVKTGLVTEDTDPDERRGAIQSFRDGRIEALVNVTVLTEGFDVPEVDGVHLLRPTKSTALLLQMIGRGTRKSEKKERCVVYDYADSFEGKDLATVGRLFGLPDGFDFAGQSVLGQVREIEQLDEEFGGGLPDAASLADLLAEIERIDPLNLYATAAKEPSKYSDLRWRRSREDCYVLSWRSPERDAVRGDKPWLAETRRVVGERNLWGVSERLEVEVNELGKWEVVIVRDEEKRRIDLHESLRAAVEWADAWVRAERPHVVRLLDMAEAWTADPASEAQVAALVRKGYPKEKLVDPKGFAVITKGQAALLMEKKVPRFLRKGQARPR
jgi:ATP-dependent helicase IRC3